MGKLTAAVVKALTKPGKYSDGDTLLLVVAPGGSKSWIQRVSVHGKRRDIGLGGWPVVSLAKARERAFRNRIAIADGRDPLAEKRKAMVPSFREAAERTFAALKPRWRNAKVAANWIQQLERHAFPHIGDLPVDQIDRERVLSVLVPLWTSRPEAGRRVRRNIRATLAWAQAHGYVEHNAAGEAVNGALPAQPAVRQHFRALPYAEIPTALQVVAASTASQAVKLCFRWLTLTAARSGEARNAEWQEVDTDARLWVIPGEKMKGGVQHRQPLSDATLEVLEQARSLDDGSGLVFPSPTRRGQSLSDMTLTKLLRDNGLAERTTIHGLRATFRTWASERTDAEHAVAELSLAHAVGNSVERAYARSDLIAKRRELLEEWGRFVAGKAAGNG